MFLSGQAQSLRSVGGSAQLNIEIASFFSKIESLGIFVFLYFMITKWKFLFQEVLNCVFRDYCYWFVYFQCCKLSNHVKHNW